MKNSYDVVIIGGAATGSAITYFLAANPDFDGSVLLVERDLSFARAATSLSASAIRSQFSTPINVQISRFSHRFMMNFAETMQVDGQAPQLNFLPGGYLFLATIPDQAEILRQNHAVQIAHGADVVLWSADELAKAFPHLNVADIELASYGRSGEGWFDNTALMNGFRNKARSLGVDLIQDEVTAVHRDGNRVTGLRLASGRRISAGAVVNAAGCGAPAIARMAGIETPIEIRKRTVFVFDCAKSPEGTARINDGRLPLMVEPCGVYCRPEGHFFLASTTPDPDPEVAPGDFDPRYDEFEELVWPALAERSRHFEAIKVVNQWAGHFDLNALDHNPVIGPHPEIAGFHFACGFSGHGLMQSPAIGRALSEMLVYGEFRTLDLSPLAYTRILNDTPFHERVLL
ncbi:NAD(P)/FAD-dependent oxidoreductase [Paenirhodobacter sp.]|uniref:NAD(P)/FAD-dependent oxidoreductase n=1 Tax=Paenirhodobacter sp. TaxID=1965326 RepID=UPI003B3CFDEF